MALKALCFVLCLLQREATWALDVLEEVAHLVEYRGWEWGDTGLVFGLGSGQGMLAAEAAPGVGGHAGSRSWIEPRRG